MIFRQLFDEKTWTYTYILADSDTHEAIIIDPVRDQVERDMRLITELGLTLRYILDTHIHADHITGSGLLREKTGAQIVMWMGASIAQPDILLTDGEVLHLWNMEIQALATPGHTDGCTSYCVENMVFTGDALLIRKTGRTDFQWGSPEKLYHSIMTQIYTLSLMRPSSIHDMIILDRRSRPYERRRSTILASHPRQLSLTSSRLCRHSISLIRSTSTKRCLRIWN